MKKQIRAIIIISLAVLALVGILLIVTNLPGKEKNTSNFQEPLKQPIYLTDKDISEIKRITIKNSSGETTINVSTGNDTISYSIDGLNNSEHLSKEKIESIINSIGQIDAKEIIIDKEPDLAQFGLYPEKASIKITYSDGTEKILYIGNEAPFGKGTYLKTGDNDTVYLVSNEISDKFLENKNSYIENKNNTSTQS